MSLYQGNLAFAYEGSRYGSGVYSQESDGFEVDLVKLTATRQLDISGTRVFTFVRHVPAHYSINMK